MREWAVRSGWMIAIVGLTAIQPAKAKADVIASNTTFQGTVGSSTDRLGEIFTTPSGGLGTTSRSTSSRTEIPMRWARRTSLRLPIPGMRLRPI